MTPPVLASPAVLYLEQQSAAVIPITVPRADMPKVMGPAVAELRAALRDQGITPAGALFAHHLRMDDAVFEFELGLPTDRAVAAVGRVRPGSLPAGPVARTTHSGGYEGLGASWAKFRRWIAEHGHTSRPDLWESYVLGPEAAADPAAWRTMLTQPLTA